MRADEYVEKYQPIVARTFRNALTKGKIAHAYLLSGEPGIPLKHIAMFMAKSLLCDHPNPFADMECVTCQRIDKGQYPDLVVYDGSEGTIKKDEIEAILANFSKTALERKGIMVYVIHLVENMTTEAVNSLLKFLEEPTDNTFAILTTENESKVLPTIISRCETMRLLLRDRKEVIDEAMAIGVMQADAEILSNFFNDAQLIKEESEDEDFIDAKSSLEGLLDSLAENPSKARFFMENNVVPSVKGKQATRFFFDMLTLVFQDLNSIQSGGEEKLGAYVNILSGLANKLPHLEESLLQIMTLRRRIEQNINGGLLLTHLIDVITKA